MVRLTHPSISLGDERLVSSCPSTLPFVFLPQHVSQVYLGSSFYWLRAQQPPRLFKIKHLFDLEHIKTMISTVFQQVVFKKLSLSF